MCIRDRTPARKIREELGGIKDTGESDKKVSRYRTLHHQPTPLSVTATSLLGPDLLPQSRRGNRPRTNTPYNSEAMLGPISPFKVSLEETRSEAARYKTARSEAGLFSSHKAQPFRRYQTPTDKLGPDEIIRRPPGTDTAFDRCSLAY